MKECPECDGHGSIDAICSMCNGSGEGMWDGSTCHSCRGMGEQRIECEECKGIGEVEDDEDNDDNDDEKENGE